MADQESLKWRWEIARNSEEVHHLLLASDAAHATPEQPAPRRNPETSRLRVADRSVHLLRCGVFPAAMFTLTTESPFDVARAGYPPAARPLYLQRLAIDPEVRRAAPLAGVRALRRAIEMARIAGADVIRSETNPDLGRICAMLRYHGFMAYGSAEDADGRRHIYLQKAIV